MTLNLTKETQINHKRGPLWRPQVALCGFTVEKLGNGESSKPKMLRMFPYHLLHHYPVRQEAEVREEV